MSDRYRKNIKKISSMVDGDYKEKIQSGYTPTEEQHKIGDKWFDSEGIQWEQKNGYRSKVSKVNVGMFSKQCKECDKPCTKSFDVDTYNRMERCYKCQVHFEEDLKYEKKNRIGTDGNKWQFWVKLQQLKRWDSIDRDMEQLVSDIHEQNQKKVWDKSVANAMSNANLEMSIKQNKA